MAVEYIGDTAVRFAGEISVRSYISAYLLSCPTARPDYPSTNGNCLRIAPANINGVVVDYSIFTTSSGFDYCPRLVRVSLPWPVICLRPAQSSVRPLPPFSTTSDDRSTISLWPNLSKRSKAIRD